MKAQASTSLSILLKLTRRGLKERTSSERSFKEAPLSHNIEAINSALAASGGNKTAAAEVLGLSRHAIRRALQSQVHDCVALGGGEGPIILPTQITRINTNYDGEGNITGQKVSSRLGTDRWVVLEEWIKSLLTRTDSTVAAAQPMLKPLGTAAELLAVYPIGDPHFGLLSWGQETDEDFDTEIAKALTEGAIDHLVAGAPKTGTALVAQLGDMFHADSDRALTPQSGHLLDVDTRLPRAMKIGFDAMVHVITKALYKHDLVIYRGARGNHDPTLSWALSLALSAWFRNEPRVVISLSPKDYWFMRFGNVLLGVTHGDKAKPTSLPGIMANDVAADWGQTKFRYVYRGHVHHDHLDELPGCKVESFQTLAAKDAWHTGRGYRSGRSMKLIVHHKDFGEVQRHTCPVELIERNLHEAQGPKARSKGPKGDAASATCWQ